MAAARTLGSSTANVRDRHIELATFATPYLWSLLWPLAASANVPRSMLWSTQPARLANIRMTRLPGRAKIALTAVQ